MTELEVVDEIHRHFGVCGASAESFGVIVAFGENAGNPHASPSNRKLKISEFILLDIGCVYRGYCSDITRVF
jgi:Xaa-Pro aminopeptidase